MKKMSCVHVCAGMFLLFISCLALPQESFDAQGSPEVVLYSQVFDDGIPAGWKLGEGWLIAKDEGSSVLCGTTHSFVLLPEIAVIDASLRFRLKLDPEARLHANMRQGLGNVPRYFIGLGINDTTLSKQTGPDNFHSNLARGTGLGEGWHNVEISVIGDTVRVFIDGSRVLEYVDRDPALALGMSFECLTENKVFIDDVEILGFEELRKWTWVRTGGPLGGIGYDVRMRPDNPDIMFVSDAAAGIFVSRDGGLNWEPSNTGITTRGGSTGDLIPIFCLTIDPNNPEIVWTGTQGQTGIFKSTDGGMNWNQMDEGILEEGLTLRGFSVQPGDSDIVYAAGEVSSWEWNGSPVHGKEFDRVQGVVYKTVDGGRHWLRVWRGDNLARYILIDPVNTDILYVSTGIFDREAANSDHVRNIPGGVGILKSIDGGATWTQVNNGLENLYIGSLAMQPGNPRVLLAGAVNAAFSMGGGTYLSLNEGETWRKIDTHGHSSSSVDFCPSNPDIAYTVDGAAIFRSADGGLTWTKMTPPSENLGPPGAAIGTPIDIEIDPRNPDRIFINAYGGGNFISEDGGRTWDYASRGYTGSQVRDIETFPGDGNRVIAAARSGIFISDDSGRNWTGMATGEFHQLDWHTVAIHPDKPDIILSELTCPRILARSTNGGRTWNMVDQMLDDIAWSVIEFSQSDPNVVYAGSTGFNSCGSFSPGFPALGMRRSNDTGIHWADANDRKTSGLSIISIAVHPENPDIVYFGSDGQGLWRSDDAGVTWEVVDRQHFKKRRVQYIGYHPLDSNTIFAGIERGGLKVSHDGGRKWETAGYGLNPEATVTDMAFDPASPNIVYASDVSAGVFISEDGGMLWHPANEGLLVRAVNALALSKNGKHLYAATEGAGVFRLDLE